MGIKNTHVYVLGAGASAHLGAPLMKDFLLRGFVELSPHNHTKVTSESFYMVAKLLDALYGSTVEKEIREEGRREVATAPNLPPQATVEELLTFVEQAIANGETWQPFLEYHRALHDFIFETLDSTTFHSLGDHYRTTEDGTLDHNRNSYDRLVDYKLDIEDRNCFLTFNYDTFLDSAASINNHGMNCDYGLEFATEGQFVGYTVRVSNRQPKDVDLMKLHGSLNWGRCPKCEELHLEFHRFYKRILTTPCPKCGTMLAPLLIPPMFGKQIEPLRQIWNRAERALSVAESLTIIGYSFPDADIEARWLLKSAVAKGGKKPPLTLVEPCEIVRKRIRDFFGDTVGQCLDFKSFEDYVSEEK